MLENADFDIQSGESIAIIGPNGGGKTTLLRLLLGRLTPDSGTIEVGGEAASRASVRVGYVPQSLELDRMFPVTVMDLVLMGRLCRNSFGFASRADRKAVAETLLDLGLDHLARRAFAELSGGQRQSVLLARALVNRPDILFLDEPTTHIDLSSAERLQEIIARFVGRMTVLTVSHDLNFVARHVGRVLCVDRKVRVHPVKPIDGKFTGHFEGALRQMVQHGVEEVSDHAHKTAKVSQLPSADERAPRDV